MTILAFLPIFISPDTAGEYVRDLFIVLAVSLLLSWVLALTQAPVMASFQFKSSGDSRKRRQEPKCFRKWGSGQDTITWAA